MSPHSTTDGDKDSDVSQTEALHLHELLCECEDFLAKNLDTEVPTPEYDENAYPPAHIKTPLKSRLDGWDTIKTYMAELAQFCEEHNENAPANEVLAVN